MFINFLYHNLSVSYDSEFISHNTFFFFFFLAEHAFICVCIQIMHVATYMLWIKQNLYLFICLIEKFSCVYCKIIQAIITE